MIFYRLEYLKIKDFRTIYTLEEGPMYQNVDQVRLDWPSKDYRDA